MSNKTSISLIVPVYNEEDLLKDAINTNLDSLIKNEIEYEVIIIDDGSTDNTRYIISEHFVNNPLIKYHFKTNEGFGSAIIKGIELSKKKYIMFAPVDTPLSINMLKDFLIHIGKADILISYRLKREGYSIRMKLNSIIYHFIISKLFKLSLKDYNWIQLYDRKIFQGGIVITNLGVFMLAEVLIKARDNGYSFYELPGAMHKRKIGKPTAASNKVIFRTLIDIFKFFFKYKPQK